MNFSYEQWMKNMIFDEIGCRNLSRETLELYQLNKIRHTINIAKNSKYYKEALKDIYAEDIKGMGDIRKIPFTTSKDLIKNPYNFICVPLSNISRIVTLKSSGTMENPKRIFFTEEDIEATIEFFKYGMLNIIAPGQRVMIMMPGNSPFSIGQLLNEGLNRAGCNSIIYGPVYNIDDALEAIKINKIDCIVGIPIQILHLSKFKELNSKYLNLHLKSILLSADYVPRSICDAAGEAFNCPVFTHYGMTEMGYGGGVECSAINGYHMRDIDLYTEVIDPLTGENVSEGEYGEVVFTTLRREGMPLIRYRTGDISRFLPKKCSCNDALKTMDYVKGRLSECLKFKNGQMLSIGMFDEIMFQIDNVLDYKVTITQKEKKIIDLFIKPIRTEIPINFVHIENALKHDKYLGKLIKNNNILLKFNYDFNKIEISNGMMKRKMRVLV